MLQMLIGTNIPFMQYRRFAYLFSAVLLAASIGWLVIHGGPYLSVDFTGGANGLAGMPRPNPIPLPLGGQVRLKCEAMYSSLNPTDRQSRQIPHAEFQYRHL